MSATNTLQIFIVSVITIQCKCVERGRLFDPGIVWTEYDGHRKQSIIQCQPAQLDKLKNADVKQETGVIAVSDAPNKFNHMAVLSSNKTLVMFNKPRKSIMARRYLEFGLPVSGYTSLGQPINWTILSNTSDSVNGISIDDLTGNVYWTDSSYDAIFVSRLIPETGSDAMVVVDYDLDKPHGIAVFAQEGLLFWTDSGNNPKIERSSLTGKNRILLLRTFGGKPEALTLDKISKRLYWVDSTTSLRTCDFNGNDVMYIKDLNGQYWSSIAVFKDSLIGVQPRPAMIIVINTTSGDVMLKKELSRNPLGVAIYTTEGVNQTEDPCVESNCTNICVTGLNNTAECYCRQRFIYTGNTSSLTCTQCDMYGSLLVTSDGGLYSLWRNSVDMSTVKPEPVYIDQNLSAVTVDSPNDIVFVFEQSAKVIKRIDLRLKIEKTIVTSVGVVKDLAVDWVSRLLFWTDSDNSHIMVSDYEGEYPCIILSDLRSPHAIAVHPKLRLLFWSELVHDIVESSALDGTGRRKITNGVVTSLVIDYKNDVIYMFDRRSDELKSFSLQNRKRRVILKSPTSQINSLAVLNDYIVWVNYTCPVKMMSMKRTKRRSVPNVTCLQDLSTVNGLAFHHIHTSPTVVDPCLNQKRCDQLCIPVSREDYRCKCIFGYYLAENETCQPVPAEYGSYLIVADQRAPSILQFDLYRSKYTRVSVKGLRQPYAVAYDAERSRKQIYWTDLSLRTINRANLDGSCQEIIYADKTTWFLDLIVDAPTMNVFATDYINNRIVTISISELSYSFITRSHPQWLPVAIAIIPTTRQLIVASNGKYPRLSKMDLNGENYTVLQHRTLQPRSLLIHGNELFLIERHGHINQILRSDTTGSNVSAIMYSPIYQPRAIAVNERYIFWTDGNSNKVERFDLGSGRNITSLGKSFRLYKPAGIVLVENSFTFGLVKREQQVGRCSSRIPPTHQPYLKIPSNSYCIVPSIEYGYLVDNVPGARVPNRVTITVKCEQAHHLVNHRRAACKNGKWTRIPRCEPNFLINGDKIKGWTSYTSPGLFYAYRSMKDIRIYCVGAGGGGYDAEDAIFSNRSRAGDGGRSRVSRVDGRNVICNAGGGRGGGPVKGGRGGVGLWTDGEAGSDAGSCDVGGAACSYQYFNICGSGGISVNCSVADFNETEYKNMCFQGDSCSDGKLYGGGSGSRAGGAGGGGGYDFSMYSSNLGNILKVEVGKGGYPSYATPGKGIVIISWGMNERELSERLSSLVKN